MERSPWAFIFPQLPALFPPGKGPFASVARVPVSPPPPSSTSRMRSSILILPFTYRLFGSACLKIEELRWGSPTATPPFEPLGLAPIEVLKDILPFPELNSQFGKLTDRTEGAPVPEPAEGALSKS